MEKVLQLVFKDAAGDKHTISIAQPREDITAEEAQTAMTAIINADVFAFSGVKLVSAVEAKYRTLSYNVIQ